MKFKYILEYEIEVDESSIAKKYPNYKLNFNSTKEFANSLISTNVYENGIDMSKYGLEKWGYSIKIKKIEVE